jgi:signal transduction histidine kinase
MMRHRMRLDPHVFVLRSGQASASGAEPVPLRIKAFLAIGATFFALLLGLYLVTRVIVLRSFREYEDGETRRLVQRIVGLLHEELQGLRGLTREWAARDDVFLRARLPSDLTSLHNRLGLAVLLDVEGRVVLEKAFDLAAARRLPAPAGLEAHLTRDRLVVHHGGLDAGRCGLIAVGSGVLLACAEPVGTREPPGPVRGTLVFGRPLDAAAIERLARTTLSSLSAHRVDDPGLPAEIHEGLAAGSPEPWILTRPVDEQHIAGYAVLKDLGGQPVLVLGARAPREAYARARLTTVYVMVALAAMGIASAGCALFLLEYGLLSRIGALGAAVRRVAEGGDAAARVAVTGGDELSRLGAAVNEVLGALERARLEREQAGHARAELEAQLHQAQALEAVGRLASGVVQEMNNLVVVVRGRLAMLEKILEPRDEVLRQVQVVRRAAEQAAALAQRLLAPSRRLAPGEGELDVNALVLALRERLGQVLGDRIALQTGLAPALGRVHADPLQLEQLLLNLASNARDAMPDGGTFVVETAEAELDEAFVRAHPGARPGAHVVLRVRDTGVGMDAPTRARAFEPFFTTKGLGRGTGLGLASVYGIVKHAGGYVALDSAPGRGSTFTIYLPSARNQAPVLSRSEG